MMLWLLVGSACIMLLVSGVHSKDVKRCKGVEIDISGVSNNYFIDRNDVYAIIKNYGGDSTAKKTLASIDLRKIEIALEKDLWIKNAELFFDNNDYLKVFVEEREPVARVFTVSGNTFYIDSSCMMLPLSDKFSARLPIFTGFVSDVKILSKADSSLLNDVKNISLKISCDSFLMAMVDQVDITPAGNFEMIPKIGTQTIIFGDGTDIDAKFSKLKLFYQDVITKSGWNKYKSINLQFKNQVVAVIRGNEDIIADSLKAIAFLKYSEDDAARMSVDSSQKFLPDTYKNNADSAMLRGSVQHDDEEQVATADVRTLTAPAANSATVAAPKPALTIAAKPATTMPTVSDRPKPKPEIVQPKPQRVKPPLKPKSGTHAKPSTVKPQKPNNDY